MFLRKNPNFTIAVVLPRIVGSHGKKIGKRNCARSLFSAQFHQTSHSYSYRVGTLCAELRNLALLPRFLLLIYLPQSLLKGVRLLLVTIKLSVDLHYRNGFFWNANLESSLHFESCFLCLLRVLFSLRSCWLH